MFRSCLLVCILLITEVVSSDNDFQDCVMDLAFLIDYSWSTGADANGNNAPEKWNLTLDFVQSVVRNLDVQPTATRVASVTYGEYSGNPNSDLDKGHRKARVLNDIGDIKQNKEPSGSNPGFGMHMARKDIFNPKKGDRAGIPNVIVLLITGKVSDSDMEEVMSEAKKMKDLGTSIICIGVSNVVNVDAMRKVVTEPSSENYFAVSGLENLNTVVDAITIATCRAARNRQNATSPDSSNTSIAPTSMPPTEIPNSDCILDLAFLIDYSRGIAEGSNGVYSSERWNRILSFLQSVVRTYDVQPSTTHVASYSFGRSRTRLNFDLDQGQRKERVVDDIRDMRHDKEQGDRRPGLGMERTRNRVFNPKYGDRSAIPNVIVIITREVSNNDMKQVMSEANIMKELGTSIICIGINADAMRKVVTEPSSENYFAVSGLDGLNTIVDAVAMATCRAARNRQNGASTV